MSLLVIRKACTTLSEAEQRNHVFFVQVRKELINRLNSVAFRQWVSAAYELLEALIQHMSVNLGG